MYQVYLNARFCTWECTESDTSFFERKAPWLYPSLPKLPQGVHHAALAEVLERFGHGTLQRRAVADRLNRVYELAASTRHLRRFVIFGSFVTAKDDPNDVAYHARHF